MQIHLARNGSPLGVFSEAEVRDKLSRGELNGAELAWREGMADWQPLRTIMPPAPGASPPLFSPQPVSAPAAPAGTTSGLAVGSLVCGIVGLCTFVPSLAAIIMGHIALSQIKKSQGAISGAGLAIAGLVMGYLILGIFTLLIGISLLVPAFNFVGHQANQQKATSSCKQIIVCLLAYASDNNGVYPDSVVSPITGKLPLTSNDAFRALIQEGLTEEEKQFGCPASMYQPDGNIGTAPAFDQALMANENHWALTAGQTDASVSHMPLVFENPVTASWPPKWNCDAAGKPKPGRTWPGGSIIVGKNDGSVEVIKLAASRGESVGPRPFGDGKDIFTQASNGEPQQILNVATSPPPAPGN